MFTLKTWKINFTLEGDNFEKIKQHPIPNGFTLEDIKIESSICTGEKTIGFYSAADKKLHYAELVRTNADIEDFYRKYGVENTR